MRAINMTPGVVRQPAWITSGKILNSDEGGSG
jgi:hypothetical protein